MDNNTEIEGFLGRFHDYASVDDVFTRGCCYWFAQILLSRFKNYHPILMYDQIENHFGVQIRGAVYDVTGNVTNNYMWERWSDVDDHVLKDRITRDCIMF